MKFRTSRLVFLFALWPTATLAQESDEANSTRVVQIECDGKISAFARRISSAVQQHDLAVPTRVAIKESFDQLDVNSDGTIASCEGPNLVDGCDHSLQMQAPSVVITDFLGQKQADSQMFQCKGYLE